MIKMATKAALLCVVNAICWALAPLIGRLSNASATVMAVLISVGSLIAVLPIVFTQNYAMVGSKGLLIGLVAGILNGIGVIIFYGLVSGSAQGLWEASKIIPIVFVLVPIGVVVGARLIFAEAITFEKTAGLVLACIAIWLLSK